MTDAIINNTCIIVTTSTIIHDHSRRQQYDLPLGLASEEAIRWHDTSGTIERNWQAIPSPWSCIST